MSALKIENLRKSFNHHEILKGIDLEVEDGQFLILVGPSGCGKSTLLSIIAGLEEPTEGKVLMQGADVTHTSPKSRNIAMVFQSYALYPTMTVEENIAFGLKMRKLPKEEIKNRVDEVAKILRIDTLLDRKPAELSGGQRQRVAMGRAIARNPKIYLFDEPLSNLDAQLRSVMRKEIKKLHTKMKCATVYVTHDQQEAMTLGDRIAVMNQGEIVQWGEPREIYDRPKNIFVAGFIGSPAMNFIRVQVAAKDSRPILRFTAKNTIEHFLPEALSPYVGRTIVVGLRPEMIHLQDAASDLQVNLLLIENTGSEAFATFELNGQEVTASTKNLDLAPGNAYTAGIDWARVSYFDSEHGERIKV